MSDDAPRPTRRFRVLAWIVIACVRLARWRVTVEGLHHVPRRGGAVVTWNHHGHVDFLFAAWGLYIELGRPVRALAKQELWRSRWTRWIVRFADAVPVDRGSGANRRRPFEAAVEALDGGDLVLVAPEGTISRSFEPLPFRTGAVRMAQAAGVPIVPSVSWGSHRLVTSGHGFSLRRAYRIPVSVAFGPPLHVGPDDDVAQATRRLRAATVELLHDVQERYPDGAPDGAWWVPARLGGAAPPPDPDPDPVADQGSPAGEPPFERLESAAPDQVADERRAAGTTGNDEPAVDPGPAEGHADEPAGDAGGAGDRDGEPGTDPGPNDGRRAADPDQAGPGRR